MINSYNNKLIINKIYLYKTSNSIDNFWIECFEKSSDTQHNIIVITDSLNGTYEFLTENIIEQNNYTIDNFQYIDITEIQNQGNNTFIYTNIEDTTYIKDLLRNYIINALYNMKYTYDNILDEDYKKENYPTFEEYKEYIYSSYDLLDKQYEAETLNIKKGSKYIGDGYTEYTIEDTSGVTYIFRETETMNYTLEIEK